MTSDDVRWVAEVARTIASRALLYENDVHEHISFWFREFAETLDPTTDPWDD